MRHYTVIAVGKIRPAWLREGVAEYEGRLRRFAKINIVEIPSLESPKKASPGQIKAIIEAESKAMLKRWPSGAYNVALCLQGRQIGSEGLAELIQSKSVSRHQHFVFAIGGSHGFSSELVRHCQDCISFGKNTFPHQMFRLILLEQLYRTSTIIAGTAYHK